MLIVIDTDSKMVYRSGSGDGDGDWNCVPNYVGIDLRNEYRLFGIPEYMVDKIKNTLSPTSPYTAGR
ncbi:MAG: hypothetical protein LBT92_02850 [Rickettsiales bacterium]|jgi:hypothetical protein|nr:hypothetical protein [Rickettsiales bacterium]